jgi:type IV pilus assembly protein PilC
MKLFYKAVSNQGESRSGFIEAKDPSEAAQYLRSKGFVPIRIKEQEKNKFGSIPFFGKRVRHKDVINFTRQMSSMLSSGITLLRSLEILQEQTGSPVLKEVMLNVIRDIQEGSSLSNAISKHPNIFSPVYISLIEASESSGLLDKAFLRLADTLEKQQKLKNTVRSALTYPAIVVVLIIAVTIIMVVFVIPQISGVYESLNVDLPLPTLILLNVSSVLISFWYVIPIVLTLLIIGFNSWHRTTEGRLTIDSMLLKIPIFGDLIKKTILAEITRTLGVLLGSGSLVIETLNKVSNVTGNILYKNAIEDVAQSVEKGISIGDAMNQYDLFPPNLVELVKMGEQTGKLDESLIRSSDYYENEVDQVVKTLSTVLEPAILVILGAGVGFLVFSVISPIYQITSSIQ